MRFALLFWAWFLCAVPAIAADRWVASQTVGNFSIRSEIALDKYKSIIAHLPAHQKLIEKTLGLGTGKRRTNITIYRSWWTYRREIIRRLGKAVSNPALFIKGPKENHIFCYARRELASDLLHESTHAVLHSSLPYVPLWLDEGIATYFQVLPQNRSFGNPHLSSIKWWVRFGSVPSIVKLERMDKMSQMSRGDYRDSWSWVHFCMHESRAARKVLVGYLAAIRSNKPPGRFSAYLAARIRKGSERYKVHFKNWSRK